MRRFVACSLLSVEVRKLITEVLSAYEDTGKLIRTTVFVQPDIDSCISFLGNVEHFADGTASIIVLAHIPLDGSTSRQDTVGGLPCLKKLFARIESPNLKKRLLPVALISGPNAQTMLHFSDQAKVSQGALEIFSSPLTKPLSLTNLKNLMKQTQHGKQHLKKQHYASMTQDLIQKLLGDLSDEDQVQFPSAQR